MLRGLPFCKYPPNFSLSRYLKVLFAAFPASPSLAVTCLCPLLHAISTRHQFTSPCKVSYLLTRGEFDFMVSFCRKQSSIADQLGLSSWSDRHTNPWGTTYSVSVAADVPSCVPGISLCRLRFSPKITKILCMHEVSLLVLGSRNVTDGWSLGGKLQWAFSMPVENILVMAGL